MENKTSLENKRCMRCNRTIKGTTKGDYGPVCTRKVAAATALLNQKPSTNGCYTVSVESLDVLPTKTDCIQS